MRVTILLAWSYATFWSAEYLAIEPHGEADDPTGDCEARLDYRTLLTSFISVFRSVGMLLVTIYCRLAIFRLLTTYVATSLTTSGTIASMQSLNSAPL